jgi:proliferating cell nuclear antigen
MKITIATKLKKDILISLFQQLKQASNTISLYFEEKRLYIQGMDRSHVCLFEVQFSSSWFKEYEYEKSQTIHIDATILFQVISICHENQEMSLSFEEDECDVLQIDMVSTSEDKKEFDKYFRIPLTDYEAEILHIPETEYDVDFALPSKKIQEMVTQLALFGDSAKFECTEDAIVLSTEGITGEMKVNIPMDDINEYSICEGEKIESSFVLNLLNKICINTKLTNDIAFSMKPEFPMRIRYDLENDSYIQFYIAPKI